jgi:hypothetical protein
MKKLLLIGLILVASAGLYAQEGLHIGIMGAPQNTWIFNQQPLDSTRGDFDYKITWGFAGMFKLGYNFGPPFGIHTGVIYSSQGQKFTTVDSTGKVVLTNRHLSYLKIPLLIHINSDPAPVIFELEFGPQLGLLLDSEISDDGTPLVFPFDQDQLYKLNDLSLAWSIGLEIVLTKGVSVVLQHRGDYSIFDIENKSFTFQNQGVYNAERDVAYNCTLGIMGGFNFCFIPRSGGRNYKWWIR